MLSTMIIIFNFIAGTCCLIYGVHLMSSGLERANITKMRNLLQKFSGNVFSSFICGTIITAMVQSSTAVTVITVGLVNSNIVGLTQAIGIIYGTNLGTTVTTQIMTINLGWMAIPILVLGLLIQMLSRNLSKKSAGRSITGIGILFLGVNILHSGIPLIQNSSIVMNLFKAYGDKPLVLLIIGMVATMIVHSSSATVGITFILFGSGLISLDSAIMIMLGDNIGTCITAQVASIGTDIQARRTAWAHTIYNVIGVLIVIIFFGPFKTISSKATIALGQDSKHIVVNAHTLFNLLSAVLFLPFTKYYVALITWLVPQKYKKINTAKIRRNTKIKIE